MAYEDEDPSNRYGSRKNDSKGPHPDCPRNMNYALGVMKDLQALGSLEIVIHEYDNRTNVITNPMYIAFYWKDHKGNRFGNPISFHQSTAEFINEFDAMVNKLTSRGYASVRGVASMNSYK